MSEPVSLLSHRPAADTVDISPPALPADRLRNTLTALAARPGIPGSAALRMPLRLGFWSGLPNWFCDQSRELIEGALENRHTAGAIAFARHLILRRASLHTIEEQVACLHELHELRHCAIELGAAAPIAPSVSTYDQACVAVCLRLLSQTYDPFRWRHRAPVSLAAQEQAFDAAVFHFCQVTPVARPAAREWPAGSPGTADLSKGARRGVGLASARALILAALQQYFGTSFVPHPLRQRAALTATLDSGMPLVIVGGSGPIDGDDTRHAWVCHAMQRHDGLVDIFDPATATSERQPLDALLDQLNADSIAFVCTPT